MTFRIPAKTFLIGEYSALVGGSVLGLATGPGFEVNYTEDLAPKFPFHERSPAGMLWSEIKNLNLKIEMSELFNNLGGFGRSTAEYLSVLIPQLKTTSEEFTAIRKHYQELSLKSGAAASGADLAIQYFGNVTVVNSAKNSYSSMDWKFKDYDFILISTGQKIKTHEHLAELDLNLIKTFPAFSDKVVETYLQGSAEEFISGINQWSKFLESHSLTHPFSLELKAALLKNSDILCAKPCGALGADVIVVICKKEVSAKVQQELLQMNLIIQGTSADLMAGVHTQLLVSSNQSMTGDSYVG